MRKEIKREIEAMKNFNHKAAFHCLSSCIDGMNQYPDLMRVLSVTLLYTDVGFANRRSRKAFEKDMEKLGVKCEKEGRNTLHMEIDVQYDILDIIYVHFFILNMIKQYNGGYGDGCEMSATTEFYGKEEEEEYYRRIEEEKNNKENVGV